MSQPRCVSVRCGVCFKYTSSPTEWVFDLHYTCMLCEYKQFMCVDRLGFYRDMIGKYRLRTPCQCGRSPTRTIERKVPMCGGCSVDVDLTPYIGNVCFQRPYQR